MRIAKFLIVVFALSLPAASASAMSADEINAKSNEALNRLYKKSTSAKDLSGRAKGILIFPKVYKAGIGIGGEYGEGVLRVGGKNAGYYSTASASIGFQLGAQARSQILMFMTSEALNNFRNAEGWEVGVDGSVALITIGAGEDFDTNTVTAPIVGFVTNNKGLMYNLNLEGTKISKIDRD